MRTLAAAPPLPATPRGRARWRHPSTPWPARGATPAPVLLEQRTPTAEVRDAQLRRAVEWVRRRVHGLTGETLLTVAQLYRDAGAEMAAQLRRRIEEYGGEATWRQDGPLAADRRAQRLASLLRQVDTVMAQLIRQAGDETLRATVASYRMTALGQTWAIDGLLPRGVQAAVPLLPDELVRAAVLFPYEGLSWFERFEGQRQVFIDRVRRAMALSQIEGDTISQATSRLLRELGVPVGGALPVSTRRAAAAQALEIPLRTRGLTPRKHAELIARTELIRSSALGAEATYDQNADVVARVEWIATRDGHTDAVCAALDGQSWPQASRELRTPPAHPRCRCSLLPVTKTFAELGLPGLEAFEPKPRQTYREWAAARGVSEREDGGLRTRRGLRLEREPPLRASQLLAEEVATQPLHSRAEFDALTDRAKEVSRRYRAAYRVWADADAVASQTDKAADKQRALWHLKTAETLEIERRDAWLLIDNYPVRVFGARSLEQMREQLDAVPPVLAARLAAAGVRVQIGQGTVTDFPDKMHLRGIRPRGYPAGMTWDGVGAVGPTRGQRVASVGTDGTGYGNTTLHELGHAVDTALGSAGRNVSDSVEFVRLHDAVRTAPAGTVSPYYQQAGAAGREEAFASLFAQQLRPLSGAHNVVAGETFAPLRAWMSDWIAAQSALPLRSAGQ